MKDYLRRITINPKIMVGKPVVKGTRIPVYLILDLLAEGYDFKRIIEAYPVLVHEDIVAALKYGGNLVEKETRNDQVFA